MNTAFLLLSSTLLALFGFTIGQEIDWNMFLSDDNNITARKKDIESLKGLEKFDRLTIIDLSSNQISTIAANSFNGLNRLLTL